MHGLKELAEKGIIPWKLAKVPPPKMPKLFMQKGTLQTMVHSQEQQ